MSTNIRQYSGGYILKKMRVVSFRGMEIIDKFISSLSSRNLNPRTIQEYAADLKHFIGWHEYQGMDSCQNVLLFSFDQISVKELETYRQAMKDVALKATTINRRLSTIKLFFDWAYHNRLAHRNPSKHVRLVPIEKSATRLINAEEEKNLFEAVRAHGSLRDQVIISIMISTGLRAGEICELKLSDSLPLNDSYAIILEKYLPTIKKDSIYLFPSEKTKGKLSDRALRHLIKKYMDIAGLEGLSAFSLRTKP